jgi:hypothetical protein
VRLKALGAHVLEMAEFQRNVSAGIAGAEQHRPGVIDWQIADLIHTSSEG